MAECQAFANRFERTCRDFTCRPFNQIPFATVTCSKVGACCIDQNLFAKQGPSQVLPPEAKCTYKRQLCVQCSEREGMRYIRVQTNSYPSHCYYSSFSPVNNNVDFEVLFNPTFKTPASVSITTQGDLDNQVCDPDWPNTASPQGFTKYSGDLNGIVGVSFTGVPILVGTSTDDVDPFYPNPDVPPYAQQSVDQCLGTADADKNFYHFNSFSPCMMASPQKSASAGQSCQSTSNCASNTLTYMVSGVSKTLTPVGLALDGHVIYAPWKSTTQTWDDCDVDVCNGLQVNGVYAYAMTTFHPYTVGCWGPGNKSALRQSCSNNPKECNSP